MKSGKLTWVTSFPQHALQMFPVDDNSDCGFFSGIAREEPGSKEKHGKGREKRERRGKMNELGDRKKRTGEEKRRKEKRRE